MSSDNKEINSTIAAAIDLPKEEYELSEKPAVENTYPTGKVVLMYFLFGGPIGGALLTSFILIESFALKDFPLIFVGLLAGFLFGVIPATLAGFLIATFKLYRNKKGLLWSAFIGAGTTMVVATSIANDIEGVIFIMLIGVVSAVLTGLFALPKISKSNFNNISMKDYNT